MTFLEKLISQRGAVIVFTSVNILLIAAFSLYLFFSFQKQADDWEALSTKTLTKSVQLTELSRNLGYTGFIHHFKNFIIRKDPDYLLQADKKLSASLEILREMRTSFNDDADIVLINNLTRTINAYEQQLSYLLKNSVGQSTEQMDGIVRVDDTKAAYALQTLVDSTLTNLNISVREQSSFMGNFTPIFSFFILLTGSFVLVNMTILKAQKDAIEKNEKDIRIYERYNATLDHAPDPIISTDLSGKIIYCNQQATKLFNRTRDHLKLMKITDILIENDDSQITHYYDDGNGNEIPLSVSMKLYDDSEKSIRIYNIRDIRQDLKLNEQVSNALKMADHANKVKSRFLAKMSHELKTPLNSILGSSKVLSQSSFDPNHTELLNNIHQSGHHMLRHIDNLLNVAQIDSDDKVEVKTSPISVPKFIDEFEKQVHPMLQGHPLKLTIHIDQLLRSSMVNIDEALLSQVLFNLVSNAIQFTPSGTIHINVDWAKRRRLLLIDIEDQGIGISEAKLEDIFAPFKQEEDGISRSHDGLGVGLFLVKKIITAMDGDIIIKSRKNYGTIVSLEIPAVLNLLPLTHDETMTKSDNVISLVSKDGRPANPSVLIVDDNEINRMIAAELIASYNISDIDLAVDGMDGLKKIKKKSYDFVFLDIHMPKLSGLEVMQQCQQNNYFPPHCKVFAYTADLTKESINEYKQFKFEGIIGKPINTRVLDSYLEPYKSHSGASAL